jgi:hypothetical protein
MEGLLHAIRDVLAREDTRVEASLRAEGLDAMLDLYQSLIRP